MNKRKKAALAIAGGIVVLAGVYMAGRQYYTNHFFPKTTINHIACGNLTKEGTIAGMEADLKGYSLTIHDAVTDMSVSAADAGMELTETDQITEYLKAQDSNLWFLELSKTHSYEADTNTLDKAKLVAYLKTLECMHPAQVQETVDAKVVYSKDTKQFEIVKEMIGNVIEEEAFNQAVEDAMLGHEETLDLTCNDYYKQPEYTADDARVIEAKEKADKYMSAVIRYEHGDFSYTLDASEIHKLIKVKKDMKVIFKKQKMIDFVIDHICETFNTFGSERHITSLGSGDIVVSGGAYGWRVDVKKERIKLKKEIKAGSTVTRKPVYLQEAKSREKGNDIGDSYVDVSIANQRLWVIRDGEIVFSSDFVSGNPNLGRQTDKGVHFVEYKRTNYDMSNYNVSVKYWLPFNTAEGEGFHDATWRSTFGGSYYLRDGSHGCINLPLYAAQTLYNILPCGYPVIVH